LLHSSATPPQSKPWHLQLRVRRRMRWLGKSSALQFSGVGFLTGTYIFFVALRYRDIALQQCNPARSINGDILTS
jgi:hypothetical protein